MLTFFPMGAENGKRVPQGVYDRQLGTRRGGIAISGLVKHSTIALFLLSNPPWYGLRRVVPQTIPPPFAQRGLYSPGALFHRSTGGIKKLTVGDFRKDTAMIAFSLKFGGRDEEGLLGTAFSSRSAFIIFHPSKDFEGAGNFFQKVPCSFPTLSLPTSSSLVRRGLRSRRGSFQRSAWRRRRVLFWSDLRRPI